MTAVSDGTMPCPVPSPGDGAPCSKRIPKGWTADEGHGGGHWWIWPKDQARMDSGHFDARAALSMQPFSVHQPADCHPGCDQWPGTAVRS
jgi:hypothetical protein